MVEKITLSLVEYRTFRALYSDGKYRTQSFGKAFYDHFQLDKRNDQDRLVGLCEADEVTAKELIQTIFAFTWFRDRVMDQVTLE